MASIVKRIRKDGTSYLIQFTLGKRRRSLFLSAKYNEKEAQKVLEIVKETTQAIDTGTTLDPRTYAWLNNMPLDLRSRFVSAGIIEPDKRITLEKLFDRYEREEVDRMKETTARNKRQAARTFFSFVDKRSFAQDFTHSDAVRYADHLAKTKAEATKAGYIRDVRRVFNWAKERDLIESNPFDHVVRGSFKNKARERFVSRTEYAAILKELNQEGRALLALYRIGGLRRGEALLVKWGDVDFERKRLLIHSPKTEHIKGRDSRLIPLFPDLKKELEALNQENPQDAECFVIQHNRTNVIKIMRRAVINAGLQPWERLIQNLRSSRAIEIYQDFGVIAESEWIGHSETTAKDHYLHLLESDFERATSEKTQGETFPA